jgi:hypothetical protein
MEGSMSSPRNIDRGRADREDTIVVASAFVVVALAIGGLLYAYSSPEKQIQASSNQPTLMDTTPGTASQ